MQEDGELCLVFLRSLLDPDPLKIPALSIRHNGPSPEPAAWEPKQVNTSCGLTATSPEKLMSTAAEGIPRGSYRGTPQPGTQNPSQRISCQWYMVL